MKSCLLLEKERVKGQDYKEPEELIELESAVSFL